MTLVGEKRIEIAPNEDITGRIKEEYPRKIVEHQLMGGDL